MGTSRRSLLKHSASALAALSVGPRFASAQEPLIRIGVIYDLSGPFAAAGSVACAIGAQIAIDLVNERGGVDGKYKVQPINADSQSKADAAINEVERLISQEKVDIVLGVYSSAHAVPLAAKVLYTAFMAVLLPHRAFLTEDRLTTTLGTAEPLGVSPPEAVDLFLIKFSFKHSIING